MPDLDTYAVIARQITAQYKRIAEAKLLTKGVDVDGFSNLLSVAEAQLVSALADGLDPAEARATTALVVDQVGQTIRDLKIRLN